jgi:branched-chain amino acid transport system substrate-binding protein
MEAAMWRNLLTLLGLFAFLAAGCEKKEAPTTAGQSGGTTAQPASGSAAQQGSGGVHAAGPAEPGTAAGSGAADDVILIGEVGSLTGAEASFGISTRNGIELALNQANAAGGVKGKKVTVRVYDDQSKPEEAANAATRLISQDHVKLILGEVASTNSLAMAQKAQPAGVPMISPSSTNPKVTLVGNYIFRVCFIDPFQGFVMAKFARENLKVARVAVLKDQKSDYSLGLTEYFTRKFTEMGGKIVTTEAYAKGDSDFRAQLTAIKGHKPEAIYVPGYYNDVGIIARQARELGIPKKVPLLGGDGWRSEKLFELGGAAVDGSYFSDHYSPDNPSPNVQKFIAEYKAVYGSVPDSLAGLGYDSAQVAIAAMRKAPDLSQAAIRDAIAQIKDFPGVAGTISLDENRNAVKPAVVLEVEGGKLKYITTISP